MPIEPQTIELCRETRKETERCSAKVTPVEPGMVHVDLTMEADFVPSESRTTVWHLPITANESREWALLLLAAADKSEGKL